MQFGKAGTRGVRKLDSFGRRKFPAQSFFSCSKPDHRPVFEFRLSSPPFPQQKPSSPGDLSLGCSRSTRWMPPSAPNQEKRPVRRFHTRISGVEQISSTWICSPMLTIAPCRLSTPAPPFLANSSARRRRCRFVFGRPSVSGHQTNKSNLLGKRARRGALSHNISESRRMPPCRVQWSVFLAAARASLRTRPVHPPRHGRGGTKRGSA